MPSQKRKASALSDDRTIEEELDMGNWAGFENLPKDILAQEIMFRLQPKSLMILKSLNKSWYFFIRCLSKDPNFMAKHHSHAEAHHSMLLIDKPYLYQRRKLEALSDIKHGISKLVVPIVPGKKKKPYSALASAFITQFVGDSCVAENISVSHLPGFLSRRRDTDTEVYHCNGVVCLTNDLKNLTFYCPVTGDFKTFYPKMGGEFHRYEERPSGMGFGSDSGVSDFKVVRILGSVGAQVFAPGTANSWRKIEFSVRDKDYWSLWGHLYLKGYCFWSAAVTSSESVLCFDVCAEVFRDIPLPDELSESNAPSSSAIWIWTRSMLRACKDSLCLFWNPHEKSPSIDVWVMDIEKGPGFNWSWRKWLRIDRSEGFLYSLAFWRSDEILVKTIDKIALYNICTRKCKSLSIDEIFGNRVLYFGHYVNSLASVNWMMKHIRSNPSG